VLPQANHLSLWFIWNFQNWHEYCFKRGGHLSLTSYLEVDGYFGYGFDVGDVNLSVGYTGYFYTGDFDDTYQEINLGAGFGLLTLDVAIGQYDNFDGPTQDYTFYSLTLEKSGFYGKFGGFSQDFECEYFEMGYTTSVREVDLGLSLIFSNKDLVGEADEAIVFTISKSFDL